MQSILQYIRSNEASVFEFVNATAENPSTDIFMPSEGAKNGSDRHQSLNGNSRLLLKRRTSEGYVQQIYMLLLCIRYGFGFSFDFNYFHIGSTTIKMGHTNGRTICINQSDRILWWIHRRPMGIYSPIIQVYLTIQQPRPPIWSHSPISWTR